MKIQAISANFNTKTFFTKPPSVNFCSLENVLLQTNQNDSISLNSAENKWMDLANDLEIDKEASKQKFERIKMAYSENGRQYHKLSHVLDCLNQLELYCADNPEALDKTQKNILKLAIWFHDYEDERLDGHRAVDESARIAEDFLVGHIKNHKSEKLLLKELILSTKHGDNENFKPQNEKLCNLMKDINFSILGRDNKTYARHVNQLKNEWIAVFSEQDVWKFIDARINSLKQLKQLLEEGKLYSTEWFRIRYEKQAKINIINELKTLSPKEEFKKIQKGAKGILPMAMKL